MSPARDDLSHIHRPVMVSEVLGHLFDGSVKMAERELGIKPLKEFAELLEYCGVAERRMVANDTVLVAHVGLWNIWYAERISL